MVFLWEWRDRRDRRGRIRWLDRVITASEEGALFEEMLRENAKVEIVRCQRALSGEDRQVPLPLDPATLEVVAMRLLAAAKVLQALGEEETTPEG